MNLMIAFREIQYTFLMRCGLGLGQLRHGEEGSDETYVQRGISISETFRPLYTKIQFQGKISQLAQELERRMAKENMAGLVVLLRLKLTTFHSLGR